MGSSVDVWRRNASQPEPASQRRGRAAGSSGSSAHAISTQAKPPGASTVGAALTTSSETASPRMPLSRNRYALSGETTYGGFATTRSNCSPSTGSKKLPARVSMLSAPLSAALNAAKASARGFTSVATTRSACAASRIAWIPFPVQRSSARSPCPRMVRWASATDGRWTPGTWSGCASAVLA